MKRFLFIALLFASCGPKVKEYRSSEQIELAGLFTDNKEKLAAEKDSIAYRSILDKASFQIDSLIKARDTLFKNEVLIVDGVRNAYGGVTFKLRYDQYKEDISKPISRSRSIMYTENMTNYNKKLDTFKAFKPGDTVIANGNFSTDLNGKTSFRGGLEGGSPELDVNFSEVRKK